MRRQAGGVKRTFSLSADATIGIEMVAFSLFALALYLHPPTWTPPEIPRPLSDLSRLPSSAMCRYQLEFLAERSEWLENLHDLHRQPCYQPWFEAAVEDVEARRAPWLALHRAHRGQEDDDYLPEYPTGGGYAREKLAELRRLIGERAYLAGILPAAISPAFWRPAD